MSLTELNQSEDNQWNFYESFCYNKEKGRNEYARLTIHVSSKNKMLRKMNYELVIWDLFDELEKIAHKYQITHFYVNQMSRFAVYHLASNSTEYETRALYINNDNSKDVKVDKKNGCEETYVNMDLGTEDHGYFFKIDEVKTMPRFFLKFIFSGVKIRCLLWEYLKRKMSTIHFLS